MSEFQELFKSIEWHDLPVDKISIDGKNKSLSFLVASYNENSEDYDYYSLQFSDVLSIDTSEGDLNDLLSFDPDYSLEINDCSYSKNKNGSYEFEILLLLGSTKPVIKFKILAEKVTLQPAV